MVRSVSSGIAHASVLLCLAFPQVGQGLRRTWKSEHAKEEGERKQKILAQVKPLIEWLQNASEKEESGEEEESETESD